MSTRSPEFTVNATKAQLPRTCSLLVLPLELRDIIYGRLLTTPYCTNIVPRTLLTTPDDTDTDNKTAERYWRFHLYTAILLVNEQISAEATRVLYQENDFVLHETNGLRLDFDQVPTFGYFAEK
jgi:hypothetical protein